MSGRSRRAASCADRERPEPEVGRGAQLHQLRQVRAGVPDRRAGEKGWAVEEMVKRTDDISSLVRRRGAQA